MLLRNITQNSSDIFKFQFISTDLLLMKSQACPLCYEFRSAAIQCGLGTAYPMVLAPLSALMVRFSMTYYFYKLTKVRHYLKKNPCLFKLLYTLAKEHVPISKYYN